MSDLRKRLAEVARLRRALADAELEAETAKEVLALTEEARLATLAEEAEREAKVKLAEAEAAAKVEALAEFDGSNKRPLPGVEIKVFHKVYYNPKDALAWCRANAPNLLVLDAKRFEKGISDGTLLDVPGAVAEIALEPRAQLASDLSEYEEVSE